MMMQNCIFDDFIDKSAIWFSEAGGDDGKLVQLVDYLISNKVQLVSVSFDNVGKIWPWLENKKIDIYSRFKFANVPDVDVIKNISDLVRDISRCFRIGATGAQIFVNVCDLSVLVNELKTIRDDLFFNSKLELCLNLDSIDSVNVVDVFQILAEIKPDSVLFYSLKNESDEKSDFVGRLFGVLNTWQLDNTDIHFLINENAYRAEQVVRLVGMIRHDLSDGLRVFFKI